VKRTGGIETIDRWASEPFGRQRTVRWHFVPRPVFSQRRSSIFFLPWTFVHRTERIRISLCLIQVHVTGVANHIFLKLLGFYLAFVDFDCWSTTNCVLGQVLSTISNGGQICKEVCFLEVHR
jgi:hypothetical protein